jgi:predicted TIM-barrel fold metal-dependent hydrolase
MKPDWKAPPLGCDSHFHVFGAPERYPYGSADRRYKPPVAELPEYLAHARAEGFERFVFVQPSAYARDNSCMVDAMVEMGTEVCRGIVDVHEDVADAELARLDAIGVRGVRINVSPVKAFETGFSDSMLPRIRRLDARCKEIGWHLDFLGPGWLTSELMPVMKTLKCDFSVAHMGMYLAKDGVAQQGFQDFLAMLRNGNGQCWVKLTGVYRMSVMPAFDDAAPFARALIETAPDRLIWGSDFPHISFSDKVGGSQLFNLLGQWAPDESTRRKILTDNPAALFGFGKK